MTRDEFLQSLQPSPPGVTPTEWGAILGPKPEHIKIAVPCRCGECDGWAVIRPHRMAEHIEDYDERNPAVEALLALQSIVVRYLRPDGGKWGNMEPGGLTYYDPKWPPPMPKQMSDHDALGEIIATLEAAGYGAFGAGKMGEDG